MIRTPSFYIKKLKKKVNKEKWIRFPPQPSKAPIASPTSA